MKKILIPGILFLFQLTLNAQNNPSYLYKVGIADSVHSTILNEQRQLFIQFPQSYEPGSDRTYPVAYILDGEIFLPNVSMVQDYYSGGFFPEMILVGISNSENRTRDLTPTVVKTKYGMPFNEETGGADKFMLFIKEELIPYIEHKYPVTNYRTLIGHSYGGLFAIYCLVNHPNLFANYLTIDPSLDWDNQIVLKQAKEKLAKQDYHGKSVYISLSGQLHMQNPDITIDNVMQDTTDFTIFARSNIEFSNLVKQNKASGLAIEWEFFPNDLHGTIPYPSLRNGMISLFKWFQWEKTDKFNSPETSKEELYEIVKYRADKLKNHFGYNVSPYPEEIFNMSGYMNLDMGQPEKSKMFFELAIEYYPNSANAYDSMAEFYEAQKDYASALKYATKAYEISGSDRYKKRIEEIKLKK